MLLRNYPFLKELTSRLPTAESVEDSQAPIFDLITTYETSLRQSLVGKLGPVEQRAVTEGENGRPNHCSEVLSSTVAHSHARAVGSTGIPGTLVMPWCILLNKCLMEKK